MKSKRKEVFFKEYRLGKSFFYERNYKSSITHFERAHILAQSSPIYHTLVHFWMLKIGFLRGDIQEIVGQLFRIPSGLFGSIFNIYPEGNTGGADVSAFKSMRIPPDLEIYFDDSKSQ